MKSDDSIHPETNSDKRIRYSEVVKNGLRLKIQDRIRIFSEAMKNQDQGEEHLYFRIIESPTDRTVWITDHSGRTRELLMFGSNNYLGLANHPYVVQKVCEFVSHHGVGIAGPSLLNGYSREMVELEQRLSRLKGTEDTLIFSSGYNANIGLIAGLCSRNDTLLADEYNHASFFDGIKLIKGNCHTFKHNDITDLQNILSNSQGSENIFVAVEGVYSMDGDIAPLNRIVPLCKEHHAMLIIDDAHGTGVLGARGEGTLEHFGISWSDEIIMGTFSKTFAVNGGFISGSKDLIGYLRFMSRPYMFSASLPPVVVAAVHAGLDVMEKEPWRRSLLLENVNYLKELLRPFGLVNEPASGIIALNVPETANIRKMANQFNKAGIFLNAIEYPAVPLNKQRFRISVSANHLREDMDKLANITREIWKKNNIQCVE